MDVVVSAIAVKQLPPQTAVSAIAVVKYRQIPRTASAEKVPAIVAWQPQLAVDPAVIVTTAR